MAGNALLLRELSVKLIEEDTSADLQTSIDAWLATFKRQDSLTKSPREERLVGEIRVTIGPGPKYLATIVYAV